MSDMDRRKFLKISAAAAASVPAMGGKVFGAEKKKDEKKDSDDKKKDKKDDITKKLAVAEDKDAAKATKAVIDALGGMKKFVKKDDIVVVKPNMAWNNKPEEAGNTNPEVVKAVVEECLKAGAKEVKVFDRTCHNARMTYVNSGIEKAAKDAGATVSYVSGKTKFKDIDIPKGKAMKKWTVYDEILDADVFINVPVAKHHGTTRLTLGIKNLMGVMGGRRGIIHRGNINQKLADYYSVVKPDLTIMDATRVLIDKGPHSKGVAYVRKPNTVIAGVDTVAVDSYTTGLFKKYKGWENLKPEDIKYIKYAADMDLGEMDTSKLNVVKCDNL